MLSQCGFNPNTPILDFYLKIYYKNFELVQFDF